uniref:Uncharacterized protein n=1 Tax=Acrobeloides nanus TaxID=290746 RepID=A0A914DC67_9BILA
MPIIMPENHRVLQGRIIKLVKINKISAKDNKTRGCPRKSGVNNNASAHVGGIAREVGQVNRGTTDQQTSGNWIEFNPDANDRNNLIHRYYSHDKVSHKYSRRCRSMFESVVPQNDLVVICCVVLTQQKNL